MLDCYTERARNVVIYTHEEARELKHDYIGTEHILLGLFREEEGIAARVLEFLGVTMKRVRAQVVRIVGQGEEITVGQIPFTPRAKKVLLKLALREALSRGHNYIGTEHILLGLLRENGGVAARILLDLGIEPEQVREKVEDYLFNGTKERRVVTPFTDAVAELQEQLKKSRSAVHPEDLRIMEGHLERFVNRAAHAGLL